MAVRNSGVNLATTHTMDIGSIYNTEVTSPEFKELLVRLYRNLNTISSAVNLKETGYYITNEVSTSKNYFSDPLLSSQSVAAPIFRPSYRVVVNFGALPNNAAKSVAHGINVTTTTKWTEIYAVATDPVGLTGIRIPYASSVAGAIIEISVTATNVVITTAADRTSYTNTFVVLEYLKF